MTLGTFDLRQTRSITEFHERLRIEDIESYFDELSNNVTGIDLSIQNIFNLSKRKFPSCKIHNLGLHYTLLKSQIESLHEAAISYSEIAARTISCIHSSELASMPDSLADAVGRFFSSPIHSVTSFEALEKKIDDLCSKSRKGPASPENRKETCLMIWKCAEKIRETLNAFVALKDIQSNRSEATCKEIYEMALERYRDEQWQHDWHNFQLSIKADYLNVQQLTAALLTSIKEQQLTLLYQSKIGSVWNDHRFVDDLYTTLCRHEFHPDDYHFLFKHLCINDELTTWIQQLKLEEMQSDDIFVPGVSNVMLSDYLGVWVSVNIKQKTSWAAVYCVMKEDKLFCESFLNNRNRISMFCERMNRLFDPSSSCDSNNIRRLIASHIGTSFLLWQKNDPLYALAKNLHERLKNRSAYMCIE